MKLEPDSPLLTAYALGELDDTTRAFVEEALRESPQCRQAVQAIRETTRWLTAELEAEAEMAMTLSPEQRQLIETSAAVAEDSPAVEDAVLTPTASTDDSLAKDGTPMFEHSEEVNKNIVRFPRRNIAWVAACAAACLALGASIWQLQFQPGQPKTESTPPETSPGTEMAQKPLLMPAPSGEAVARSPVPPPLATPSVVQQDEVSSLVSTPPPLTPKPADAASPEPFYRTDPQLMRRYGLVPTPSPQPKSFADAVKQSSDSLSPPPTTGGAVQYAMRPKPLPEQPVAANNRYVTERRSTAALAEQFQQQPSTSTRSIPAPTAGADALERRYGLRVPPAESRDRRRIFSAPAAPSSTASYPTYVENDFLSVWEHPLSTVSIDVDTASYSNIRRFLNQGQLPLRDAVRIEEMINYFTYDYPQPENGHPFAASLEVAGCPWNADHRLIRIGLQGRQIARDKRPPCNLVFLIDVSGSMQPRERLPLIKQALRMLAKRMTAQDRIAIVVYANNSGLALSSTSGADKEKILEAIDRLEAEGSTNGGAGIQQAYQIAAENLIREGVNRVILCTDGDFNVGVTDHNVLVSLIQERAKNRIFLSALGVGTDNYKDDLLQKLADRGNGNYHYLDSMEEAEKVLIEQMNATLVAIAKDVKIQIEFNPAHVGAYRLIGYEKRLLASEDFNDDSKDAGEIGAGHSVTALYEIIPAGRDEGRRVDTLKYRQPAVREPSRPPANTSRELLTLKIRYKLPTGNESKLLEFTTTDTGMAEHQASADFKFAAAVASFGMVLKDSRYKGNATFDRVLQLAQAGKSTDSQGYRAEFINLVHKAKSIRGTD